MNLPPPFPPPPPTPRRRWGRIALIALSVVLGLVAIAIIAVPIVAPRILRPKVQAALAERVNGTVEVGEVTFSWSGKITVQGILIKDTTGGEALYIHMANLNVDLWKALRGDYDLTAAIEKPRVVLRRMPSGRLNIEELWKSTSKAEPEPSVKASVAFDGELYVDEPAGVSLIGPLAGSINVAGMKAPAPFHAQAGALTLDGQVTPDTGAWRADYAAQDMDLARVEPLVRLLSPVTTLGGRVEGRGRLGSDGTFDGSSTTTNLAFGVSGGVPMTFPQFTATHAVDAAGYRMTVKSGRAIDARAEGRREGAVVRGTVDVEGDLAELGEALRQILNVRPDATVQGRMRGHADVAFEGTADLKATFELRDVVAVDKAGRAYSIDPRVEVLFNGKVGADFVVADDLTLTSETITAKGRGAVSGLGKGQTPLASESTIDVTADLTKLRERLASLIDFGTNRLGGTATFAGRVKPVFDGFELTGNGTAKQFAFGEIGPVDWTLAADVEVVGNDSTIRRCEVNSSAGRLVVDGAVRGVTAAAEADLNVTAALVPAEAAKVLRPWLEGRTLTGTKLDVTGRVTGPLRKPSAVARIVGDDVAFDKAGPLDFTADAVVRALDVEKLDLESTPVTAHVTGKLTDASGSVTVRPNEFVRAFKPYLPELVVSGYSPVEISGRMTGGWEKPAGTVRVVAKDIVVDQAGPVDFTADVTFRDNDVQKLVVDSSAGTVDLAGSMRDASGRVTVKPESFSRAFRAYVKDVPMKGAPVELSGRVRGDVKSFAVEVRGKTGDMVVDNQAIPPFTFDAELVRTNEKFEKIVVKAPGIDVTGSGTATSFTLRGEVSPRPFSEKVGPFLKGTKLDGRPVNFEATVTRGRAETVRGSIDAPEIRGTVGEQWISQKQFRADFDFDWSAGVIDVRSAKAVSTTGSATAKGRLEELATGWSGRLDVTADGDLGTLMRDVAAAKPGATQYSGALEVRSAVVGNADLFTATGAVTITGLTARRGDLDAVDARFSIDHEASIDLRTKTLSIRRGDVRSSWVRGTISGDVLTYDQTPTLRGFSIDLWYQPEAFGKFLSLFLPGEFVGRQEQRLTAKLDGPPAAFDLFGLFNGTTGAADMDIKSYVIQGTTVEGPLHGVIGGGGRMTISGTLKGNGGTITVDRTEVDFRDASVKPASTFYVTGDKLTLSKELAKVLTSFHPFFVGGEAKGTMKFDTSGQWIAPLKSDADLKSALLVGKTMVAIPDLELKDAPFLSSVLNFIGDKDVGPRGYFVVTDLAARDGAFKYTDMVFSLQGLTLRFRGTVGFDGKLDLVMDTPITKRLYEKNKNLQPFLDKTMPVPIRGSLSDPKIFWDEGFTSLFKNAPGNVLDNVLNDLLNPKKKKNP